MGYKILMVSRFGEFYSDQRHYRKKNSFLFNCIFDILLVMRSKVYGNCVIYHPIIPIFLCDSTSPLNFIYFEYLYQLLKKMYLLDPK